MKISQTSIHLPREYKQALSQVVCSQCHECASQPPSDREAVFQVNPKKCIATSYLRHRRK